ncbi:hypothetical protein BT96DRAFT_940482 [Gymnopus androsaceus JB14]|uniref:DUF6570 domain-containing protein n=1 Tax=Gymnopus androsaceus JB14 TaxID=1447944 RepID=A0A6A4HKL1_9AGAR|nr:hypothetical protein BT96DRAFT_940482 [Gymnopus androsaceus JB14]
MNFPEDPQNPPQLNPQQQVPSAPPSPPPMNFPEDPQNSPQLDDGDKAISEADELCLLTVQNEIMDISMEICTQCHERWFDMNVNQNGVCQWCRKSSKYKEVNNMYPGDYPSHLPQLTQTEEMLILFMLWFKFGKSKVVNIIPLLPEQLDVIIMHWKTQSSTSNLDSTEDFRNIEVRVIEDHFDDGPPQGEDNLGLPENPQYSRGFVPGVNS